ncbi:MAG TPA: hypothetical protein PLR52_08235 [Bacteroidales bacterium]|nr:hypothetical protein [Bacteroidales bacterium]HPI69497.1 hypothetical protein [Bacteroidales bacterium]
MKKLIMTLVALIAITAAYAQTIEEIVAKYTVANKLDKISSFKTIKITGKVSIMGMDLPVEMWMKNPNKIKTVTSMDGQENIQVFDGEKGYIVNSMMGSSEPVELSPDQVAQLQNSNVFQNTLDKYLKNGQLSLLGEENVNGKPAYKVKASLEGGLSATLFIDKSSFYLIKQIADINQGGVNMSVESYPSDYKDISGIVLPMKTSTSMSGMDVITSYTSIEVDIPIDDSVFSIK